MRRHVRACAHMCVLAVAGCMGGCAHVQVCAVMASRGPLCSAPSPRRWGPGHGAQRSYAHSSLVPRMVAPSRDDQEASQPWPVFPSG